MIEYLMDVLVSTFKLMIYCYNNNIESNKKKLRSVKKENQKKSISINQLIQILHNFNQIICYILCFKKTVIASQKGFYHKETTKFSTNAFRSITLHVFSRRAKMFHVGNRQKLAHRQPLEYAVEFSPRKVICTPPSPLPMSVSIRADFSSNSFLSLAARRRQSKEGVLFSLSHFPLRCREGGAIYDRYIPMSWKGWLRDR